jgi:hypothetical protein
MEVDLLQILGVTVGPGGAVYLGIKMALNGLRKDLAQARSDIRETREDVRETRDCARGIHEEMILVRERLGRLAE